MSNDRDRIRRSGGSGYNDNDPNNSPPPSGNWLLKILAIGAGVFGLIALLNTCTGPKGTPELSPSPTVSTSPVVPTPSQEPTTGTTEPSQAPSESPSPEASASPEASVPPFVAPLPDATIKPEVSPTVSPTASPTDSAPNGGTPETPTASPSTSPSASAPLDMDDGVKRSSYSSDDQYYADLAVKAKKDSETVQTKLKSSGLSPAQTTYLQGLYDKYVKQAEVYTRLSTDEVKK
jgi:hypothetical protein